MTTIQDFETRFKRLIRNMTPLTRQDAYQLVNNLAIIAHSESMMRPIPYKPAEFTITIAQPDHGRWQMSLVQVNRKGADGRFGVVLRSETRINKDAAIADFIEEVNEAVTEYIGADRRE